MIENKKQTSCPVSGQLSIYLHIPFCVKKCDYCDFFSAPPRDGEMEAYAFKLIEEIKIQAKEYKDRIVVSIFFGGGTPSLLPIEWMEQIMRTVRDSFCVKENAEITIEMNPGTVTQEALYRYQAIGINRLSIGLQSAQNEELKRLGRIHSWEEFHRLYSWAREAGFSNINVDLMAGLPEQTLDSYEASLQKVIALEPEHISSYGLILEEGTRFFKRYPDGEGLPDEEVERQMYQRTKELLEANDYTRYEISNYAKKGYECKHNTVYWMCEEYLGFGMSAASLVNGVRWKNAMEDRHHLSKKEQMEEYMFLGLRRMQGVSEERFLERFGQAVRVVFAEPLASCTKEGLLAFQDGYWYLTPYGIDVSNQVFYRFLLEEET